MSKDDIKHEIPTGKFKRASQMTYTASRIGLKHLGHKSKNIFSKTDTATDEKFDEEIGRMLFSTLNQLKGVALKASQIMSMEEELLPAGLRKELKRACFDATPLNKAHVYRVIKSELGAAPQKIFKSFETAAFAAASLGQVHLAQNDAGENLAVKIQYPGIAASITSDMTVLKNMMYMFAKTSKSFPSKELLGSLMDEIEIQVALEVDYENEADNITWFLENVAGENIIIPRYFSELSSQRVLTMEMLKGKHIDQWLETAPSQELRNHFGQTLFDLFHKTFYGLHRIHADPHAGNYLFMQGGKLGVLDFGAVKEFEPKFVTQVSEFYTAVLNYSQGAETSDKNLKILYEQYISFITLSDDFTFEDYKELFWPLIHPLFSWVTAPYKSDRFDFGNREAKPMPDVNASKKIVRYLKKINDQLPFFDRSYHGLCAILTKIGAVVDTRSGKDYLRQKNIPYAKKD
jgi:predicted unusual protein kinase regulating ubiquinone biosynthesis (AarF/ABC1/UbiB family)